jgi:hypothetical protein
MAFNPIGIQTWLEKADAAKAKEDELIRSREDALLDLYIKSGGSGGTGKSKDTITAAESALKLQQRINDSGIEDEDTLNYLSSILDDPYAAKDVLDFIEDQAINYDRVINLQDLPTIISIVQAPTSVQDKIDLFKEFDVVDLTNKEEYYKLAKRITDMTTKGGRTVFVDIQPETIQKTDYAAREQQYQSVIRNVVRTARAGLENDPDKVNAQNALNNLKSSDSGTRADAEAYLLSRFITPEFITSLEEENPSFYRGLSKHPNIREYIKSSMPTTPQNKIYPEPSSADITLLKQNKNSNVYKNFFDETYGPGATDKALGDTRRTGPSGL